MKTKPARSHEDLIVWQKAHQFVLDIYTYTRKMPKEEQFVLIPQLRSQLDEVSRLLSAYTSAILNSNS